VSRPTEEHLKLKDVAAELQLSVKSIRRKIADGLPVVRLNARVFRIRRSDLNRYLAGRRSA
jgi:hypothetical protein